MRPSTDSGVTAPMTASDASPIRTERHGDVLVIISDNPPVNALGAAVREGLDAAV